MKKAYSGAFIDVTPTGWDGSSLRLPSPSKSHTNNHIQESAVADNDVTPTSMAPKLIKGLEREFSEKDAIFGLKR